MKFVRFGVLKAQKQIHYDESSFYSPPARHGFYAFPYGFIPFPYGLFERHLLINMYPSHHTQKTEWIKFNGEKLKAEFEKDCEDWLRSSEDLSQEIKSKLRVIKVKLKDVRILPLKPEEGFAYENLYLAKIKKRKYFDYKGEIWHHLGDKVKPNEIKKRFNEWWILTDIDTYSKCLKRRSQKEVYDREWGELRNSDGELSSFQDYEVFIEKL